MGRLLYYLPSGHRTESHIPHLSLFLFPLCVVSFSHKSSLLSSAVPSCLFLPFFHPSDVHVCFLFPPLCHCCSVSFAPSPFLCVESICSCLVSLSSPAHLFLLSSPVVSSSSSASSSSVDSCLSRGNLFNPSLRALSSAVPT